MTGKEYRSLVGWSVVLLVALAIGFLLLARVVDVPLLVIVAILVAIVLLSVFLIRSLRKLAGMVDNGKGEKNTTSS